MAVRAEKRHVIRDDAFCDLEAIRLDMHTAVDRFVDEYQARVHLAMQRHLQDRRRARLLPQRVAA